VFHGAAAFNQNLSPWNVGAVTTLNNMFKGATAFSQTLCWVTSDAVSSTFGSSGSSGSIDGSGTGDCAPPIAITNDNFKDACTAWVGGDTTTYGAIADWDTSSVTDMSEAFHTATTFNDDISLWNTGQVTKMRRMFQDAAAFNQDISSWNTISVTDMWRVSNESMTCCLGALR
jgi:surface protein